MMTDEQFAAALAKPLTQQDRTNAVVLATQVVCGDGWDEGWEADLAILVVRLAEALRQREDRDAFVVEVERQNAAMRAVLDKSIGEWGGGANSRVLSPRQCGIIRIPVADRCLAPADCEYATRGWCPRCEPTTKTRNDKL